MQAQHTLTATWQQVIHDFYARYVESRESIAHIPKDDAYSKAVEAAVDAGQGARWLDLVGTSSHVQVVTVLATVAWLLCMPRSWYLQTH